MKIKRSNKKSYASLKRSIINKNRKKTMDIENSICNGISPYMQRGCVTINFDRVEDISEKIKKRLYRVRQSSPRDEHV